MAKSDKTKNLKESVTNSKYQSTFLPQLQRAETQIKILIVTYLFLGKSLYELRLAINEIIKKLVGEVPSDLHDRAAYLNGLVFKSNQFVNKYYLTQLYRFQETKKIINQSIDLERKPTINSPKDLIEFTKKKHDFSMWQEAKGNPNVINYEKQLKAKIKELADSPITTFEEGKKPISLWQKAELDIRYENQMAKLDELKNRGVNYAYISSHPNASKRCEPYQGKLVALNLTSENPDFTVGYLDGKLVYSLPSIMAQVDKYGYHNNIICGFNCRHRLIPYVGQNAPTKYSEKNIARERKIEQKMREIEREIRKLKTNEILSFKIGNIEEAETFKNKWKKLYEQYKKLCEKEGYAFYPYRVNVI